MSDNEKCKDHLVRLKQWEDATSNTIPKNIGTKTLIEYITQWHHERNLIEGSTDKDQFCKLMQEAGELSDSICKGKDVSDDIGDMIVVLINIAERNSLSISSCLNKAWDDIKDRKGKMVDGVFVKESDL
jgi:NTP pyrophosphatase (non-canonical NTP hydrolase)